MSALAETRTAVSPTPAAPLVLIVNGDASMRASLQATITQAGLRAISFSSAAEYSRYSDHDMASCVILDVSLPDGSGLDLHERLALDGTSVVFVTGDGCVASCARAIKAGAVDFLTMPCRPEDLMSSVLCAIRRDVRARADREQLGVLRGRLQQLTRRERQVFSLVASGLLNKQVAQQLSISEITVQIHRGRVMKKMAARSLATLVRMADALQISALLHEEPTHDRQSLWCVFGAETVGADRYRAPSLRPA